jgi:AcrR family transcriptional regulator
MPSTKPSSTPSEGVPRRRGRPTAEDAARLDEAVKEHALRLFLEHGYENTSMNAIASAAGTTKVSLYGRFPSKEVLFSAVLSWAVARTDWPVPEPEPPDFDDLEEALTVIARASRRRALHPSMVKLSRLAIAQAARFPDLARRTHATAGWPRQQLVADLLRRHAATGAIVADEPDILARHFVTMVAGGPARMASFGVADPPEAQERHMHVAIDLFLRSLRP